MNTINNKDSQVTEERLKTALLQLLKEKELDDISVAEICDVANLELCTFYMCFEDVFGLGNACSEDIEKKVSDVPHKQGDFMWIFEYIKANKELFEIYFKLGISKKSADYKTLFFRNGVYAVAKMWFKNGCMESPEQMGEIIKREYNKIY